MDLLFLDFVNSKWYATHPPHAEMLSDKQWVTEFLQRWNLPTDLPLTEAASQGLINLRAQLIEAVQTLSSGNVLTRGQIAKLNSRLALSSFIHELDFQEGGYRQRTKPVTEDWNYLQGMITLSLTETIVEEKAARIKSCGNPDCGWFFFDESKSRTRNWCGNTCASLIKVRRFRERKKRCVEP